MRTLMALLTLGAGGAGYAYLQQTSASGDNLSKPTTARSLSESNRLTAGKADSRGSVKQMVTQIHEHTKLILDDFAIQHGGHSDAPTDNAFQRLKQVTQSTDATITSNAQETDEKSLPKSSLHPAASKLDELQRMAFDPAAVDSPETPFDEPTQQSLTADSDAKDAVNPIHVVAGNLDTLSKTSQPGGGKDGTTSIADADFSSTSTKEKRSAIRIAAGTPAQTVTAEWKVIGKTTERRPIHTMHLGNGGTKTLVIAGLDGQDRVAVRWLEQLADSLSKRPDLLENNEVLFYRAGNPDGLVRKAANNSRGVQLNRNFPSRRKRPGLGLPSLSVPASEVETRVILDTIHAFKPQRVIHLVSTSARSQVVFNRLAKETATQFGSAASVHILPLDAEQLPGSLEDFTDGTLQAAILTMRLNAGTDWQKSWTDIQPRVLSAIVGRPANADENGSVIEQDPNRTQMPLPLPNVEPISRRRGGRGYEELPTPPQT